MNMVPVKSHRCVRAIIEGSRTNSPALQGNFLEEIKMAKIHCMAYLERYCISCKKKILGRIFDYGVKDPDFVEDWCEEVELSILPLPCDSCGNSSYPSLLSIYEQDQYNRPIRRIYAERIGRLHALEVKYRECREEIDKRKEVPFIESSEDENGKRLQKMVLSYVELAAKMRARIVELESSQTKVIKSATEPPEEEDSLNDDDLYSLAKLENRKIGVFGWPKDIVQLEGVLFQWHHGNCIDHKAVSLTEDADILVCLTRYSDSNLIWWLQDVSISHQIPLILLDNKNIHHIIQAASNISN